MGAHQFWKREQFNEKEHFSKKVGYNLATKLGGEGVSSLFRVYLIIVYPPGKNFSHLGLKIYAMN